MSRLPVARQHPLAVLVGATLCFTTMAIGTLAASAVVPKVPVDLSVTGTAPAGVSRTGTAVTTEALKNVGPVAAPGLLVITVDHAAESSITPHAGLTCGATVPNLTGTGFTQQCATDAPLPSGATLSVSLTIAPLADPHLISVPVRGTVSFPVVGYTDPVLANNRASKTVKILEVAELAAAVTGSGTVSRDGLTVADATISNLGGNPVYARLTIVIANGSEVVSTAGDGLCSGGRPNTAGTGFSRICTTSSPLASGSTLPVQLVLQPSSDPSAHAMTVTGSAAKASGNVTDPVSTDNRSALKVLITDSADLATTITGPASVTLGQVVSISGTIADNGPDAVSGKAVIRFVGGTITSTSSDSGLICVGAGAMSTCTVSPSIPTGTTLHFTFVVTVSSSSRVTSFTATSTASLLGGVTLTDPDASNDVATSTSSLAPGAI